MPVKGFKAKPEVEIINMYGGDVVMEYSDKGHRYAVTYKGKPVIGTVGCTTVTGVLNKPYLVPWAARITNDAWVNGLKQAGKVDELTIASLSKSAPLEWQNKRDSAGDLGTLIHNWVESWIKAKVKGHPVPDMPTNPLMNRACLDFLMWAKQEGITFISSEQKVYSLKHNIAGTCDFTYRAKNGRLGIGDLKTSKGIYDNYYYQVAGYRYMLEEEARYMNSTAIYDEMTIVKVGKGEGKVEIKKFNDYRKHAKVFLACSVIYRAK